MNKNDFIFQLGKTGVEDKSISIFKKSLKLGLVEEDSLRNCHCLWLSVYKSMHDFTELYISFMSEEQIQKARERVVLFNLYMTEKESKTRRDRCNVCNFFRFKRKP
jgi:hypothetical protein